MPSKWFIADNQLPRLLQDKAPEDIDTLRDESEDDTDLFHHWVQSPPDLRAPNMNNTKKLDRAQEEEGLDDSRHAEDAEDFGAPSQDEQQFLDEEPEDDPVMPINPPATRKSRRTHKGAPMSRYYYAADEDGGEDGGDDTGEYTEGDTNTDDIDQLLDEAEADIDAFQGNEDGGFEDGGDDEGAPFDPDGDGDDDSTPEGDTDHDYFPEDEGDEDSGDDFGGSEEDSGDDSEGEDGPPWADEKEARTVRRRASRGNKRGGAMTGSNLSQRARVAKQGRRFHADDDGHTDGGPYGVDDSQGAQEEIFISQVPGAEAVETGGDGQISNGPGNLVAKRSQFDPNHYQRLADTVRALPASDRGAVAAKMVRMLQADNRRFNPMTFFEAAQVPMVKRGNRYFIAEDLKDADTVNPELSGTDCQEVKGDDFESLALDNVETQPKDASIHAFKTFDKWLAQTTGRTAAQHGNANFISRKVAEYCRLHKNAHAALASLFPTMEYVLREARKVEGKRANMRKRAEDTSLDVAAPEGRIDVEAPVKNVTDADAQASQFDEGDFANNAGDNIADPVLDVVDGNAGTWAPDKEAKLASGVEAVRLAEAYISAMPGKYRPEQKWELIARFESMRSAAVRDRIRVLEDVVRHNTSRKVTAASSRGTNKGIPSGLGRRTAASGGQKKISANDPATDYGLFI